MCIQLTLLLLGDASSHASHNGTSRSRAPSTTNSRTHHTKNGTSLGVVERVEKRVTAMESQEQKWPRLTSESQAQVSNGNSTPVPRAKSKFLIEPAATVPPVSTVPPGATTLPAAAANPSPPPAVSSGRVGWWVLLALALLVCVLLAVPAKARLRLLTHGLGGMSAYAQQLCSFCVLVATMTVAMLLFKVCQVDGAYMFSPASSVALTELCKLTLALGLHALGGARTLEAWREGVSGRVMLHYAGLSAAYTFNNQAHACTRIACTRVAIHDDRSSTHTYALPR